MEQVRDQFPRAADDFVQRSCKDTPLTAAQYRLLERLRTALNKATSTEAE